jgi:putative PIN family toxin of toxin-antitoxin system
MKIVIDSNVFISALIKKEGLSREIIINSYNDFLFSEYEFQEIYKYKEDIPKKSGYSEIEFIQAISLLLNYMKVISNEEICDYYDKACEIMNKIDHDDAIFIAIALAFDAVIWSDDYHFKMQNKIKSLTTEEMKNYSN